MNSPELNSALAGNIADLEVIAQRLGGLDEIVDEAVNKLASDWAAEHAWFAQCDEDEWSLSPMGDGWYTPTNEDDSGAYFEFAFFEDINEDNYFVTSLCQKGHDKVGIRFVQQMVKRNQWKKIVSELSDLVADTGFVLEERKLSFFLSIKIDPEVLAAGIAGDDLEDGLHQCKNVLDQLLRAKPAFDKVIARIKEIS